MKKPRFWSWILCALWLSAVAQADSPTDEASNDDARCACAASCSSKQECEESDCGCANKEVLPTDPTNQALGFDDRAEKWTLQESQ